MLAPHANQARTSKSQPYYLRGDARFDNPDSLKKRKKLLESGRIGRAARQFWDLLGLSSEDTMSYEDYYKVCT